MLDAAFNMVLKLHGRNVTLRRKATLGGGADSTSVARATPSNYFRKVEGPSFTTIKGRELIIPKASIVTPFTAPVLKLGDRVEDAEWGNMAIIEIQEMCDLGGSVMGYRVRVE